MVYTVSENKLVYKREKKDIIHSLICYIPVVALISVFLVLLAAGIACAVALYPSPDIEERALIMAIWIICQAVWYALLGFGICYFLYEFLVTVLESCKDLILDDTGVYLTLLFFKMHIRWADIKDYGLSYQGVRLNLDRSRFSSRGYIDGRIYKVYFSTQQCDADINKGKKKLKGVKVWWLECFPLHAYLRETGEPTVQKTIFDFCEKHTGISPFIPGNAYSHIYDDPEIEKYKKIIEK